MDETRHELVERYRDARRTLEEAVSMHPDAAVGRWHGREVLMHVIGWDRYGVAWVPRLFRGEREDPYDEDEVNASFVAQYRSLDDAALHGEYAAAGDEFVAMLDALPDEAFVGDAAAADWARGLADHALEHAAVFGDIGS